MDAVSDQGLTDAEFAAVYERHVAEILRYAIRCTGRRDIAEELASEAFLKMYQMRQTIDPNRAAAWLTTSVKNLATDYWRRTLVERKHSAPGTPPAAQPPSDGWDAMMEAPSLKPEHRMCLTLHFLHGMERKEISAHTGLSDNQVKNCLQYGLKLLRDACGVKK